MDEILIGFGSELKLLANGHIGGHLVRFTRKSNPDLAGDYFDAETDFGFEDELKTPVFLNHRLPLETADGKSVVVKKKIGEATLTKADDGIVIDAILYERKKYEKVLSVMGWSSGTAGHLSDRTRTGKSFHVDFWQLGADASITPAPCDPDNICSLKSYKAIALKGVEIDGAIESSHSLAASLTRHIDDLSDESNRDSLIKSLAREAMMDVAEVEAVLDGSMRRPSNAKLKAFARVLNIKFETLKSIADAQRGELRSIKGMFEDELAGQTPSTWQLWNIYCSVVSKIAEAADAAAEVPGVSFDSTGKVREATREYSNRLEQAVVAQVDAYASGEADEPEPGGFYLKSLFDPTELAMESIAITDHCSLAESAFKGVVARMSKFNAVRVKAGRVLSEKNRARLAELVANIKQSVSDCESLLEETKPMATDEAMRAARTKHLALRTERRINQLGA